MTKQRNFIMCSTRVTAFALASSLLLLVGCGKKTESLSTPYAPVLDTTPVDPAATAATEAVWQQQGEAIHACIDASTLLRQQIHDLLDSPTAETLAQTQQRWHATHAAVLTLTPVFAMAESNPGLFGDLSQFLYQLDGHPIQPGFIDYFDVYLQSGIVNDIAIALSAEALRQQHGITDATDVSIGLHALEYLLWGEKGQRPVSDFVAGNRITEEQRQQGLSIVDLPANRRRDYVQLLSELLVDDCTRLHQAWLDPSSDVFIRYHELQTNSRLQLWQGAMRKVVETLQTHLGGTAATPATASDANDATQITTESEWTPHNAFAGKEAQVIAAQLRGLSLILSGSATPSVASDVEVVGLAQWINSPDTPQGTAALGSTQPAQSLAALLPSLQKAIATLTQATAWPLPDAEQKSLIELLNSLHQGLRGPDISPQPDRPEDVSSP